MRLAASLCLMIASLVMGAAGAQSEATASDLALEAQRILDARSPEFDKAQAAIDRSMAKQPNAPALVQKARLVIMLGGEGGQSLEEAEHLLQGASNLDFNYGPAYVMHGYVFMRLDRMAEAGQSFFRAGRMVPDDPQYLYYYAMYLDHGFGDPAPYYERYVAFSSTNASQRADADHWLLQRYVARRDRAKADATFNDLLRTKGEVAELYGDYARAVMTWFTDFTAGEQLARKAISLRDYVHARQSLSLALYGKWAEAKRAGRSAQAAALYETAKGNDPGARNVPSCALDAPSLQFVREALEEIWARDAQPRLNC